MHNNLTKDRKILLLAVFAILLQLFDIFIHVATGQPEPIRILANSIMIIWLAALMFGQQRLRETPFVITAVSLYAVLNLIFLLREGLVNGETGELRIVLFLLVGLTLTIATAIFTSRPKVASN